MKIPNEFQVGERVQAHPATDRWMMGDRWGSVAKVGKELVHVRMDVSNKVIKFRPDYLLHKGE